MVAAALQEVDGDALASCLFLPSPPQLKRTNKHYAIIPSADTADTSLMYTSYLDYLTPELAAAGLRERR